MRPIKKLFYVIKFLEVPSWEEEKYHVVPSSWVLSRSHEHTEVAFPRKTKTNLLKYVRYRELPKHKWPVFRATTELETNVYMDALLYIEFRQNTDTFGGMMKSFKSKNELSAVRECSGRTGNVKTFGKAYNDIKSAERRSELLKQTSDFSHNKSLSDFSLVTCGNETSEVDNTFLSYQPMPVHKIIALAFEQELLDKMRETFSEAAELLEVYVTLKASGK
ncbi:uncharacterized protein LOC130664816 [Microplitis mediator]|uniref:uncharacterized protein LOC130664816 n=1 Tax=Microplitis mediator TaxID=375433 RepID=UPI0025574191|nr:uncharacterized protein LOC130664816 [Microplitis mediator]